jgi:hypothetical protein
VPWRGELPENGLPRHRAAPSYPPARPSHPSDVRRYREAVSFFPAECDVGAERANRNDLRNQPCETPHLPGRNVTQSALTHHMSFWALDLNRHANVCAYRLYRTL